MFLKKRVIGIEPTYIAWKAIVLPLNYTRRFFLSINREGTFARAALVAPLFFAQVPFKFSLSENLNGQERIRTSEAQVQQIYSLSPLATWVPTRKFLCLFRV